MRERESPAGLLVIERRALRDPVIPNGNDPASVPPGTVGPPAAVPGDPNGLDLAETAPPMSARLPPPRPTAWSGWPAEWATPNWWGRVDALTDTAWACLDLNSSVLATMPPYLVGASPTLPVEWLNNPDPRLYVSWWEFARQLFWDFYMGEAFVLCTAHYASGNPARFHVVPPWMVQAEIAAGGERVYRIGNLDVTDDILHLRYQSTTGDAHGHGPLEAGAGRLVAANALARYATGLAQAGGIPYAVLVHPDNLNATQAAELQAAWVEARMSSMGIPAVLSGGIDFKTLSLDPEQMALVDLSRFNESRIAVLLGVPPFLMGLPSGGDSMTYTNVEQLFTYHWRAGLSTKASAVMQALSGWLLPRGTTIELNRDEYVKERLAERAQAYATLFALMDPTTGERAIKIREIREAERYDTAAASPPITSGVLK